MLAREEEKVDRELLAIAYANLPPMLGMTALAATGAAIILGIAAVSWSWLWLCALLALTACRAAHGAQFPADAIHHCAPSRADNWRRSFAAGLYVSAMLWAVPALLIAHLSSTVQYTFAIMLSALAAGGTGILAASRREGRVYIALMLGAPSLLLFSQADNGLVMTVLGLIFLCVMLIVHARNHAVMRRSVELKIENTSLVHDLRSLNTDLEIKVAERTQALLDAANLDSLTRLPNRRGLMAWMEDHLDPALATEGAVLFLDLDRFKQVNDALGHDVGDRVLVMAAHRLAEHLPQKSLLARWGGDEFVVVVGSRADLHSTTHRLAQDLVNAIARPFEVDGQNVSLGLSVGLSFFPFDAADHRNLILAADLAVAEVKRNGRGQVFSYCDSYAATQKRRFDVSRALNAAVEANALELHFQPIIDADTGSVHAYEALARWRHPVLGSIDPDEFIRLAEETDIIVALGDGILRQACATAVAWTRPSHAPKVAVNVSVKQLRQDGFALRVLQILTQTGLPAARLELEVTESLFADEHLEATREAIQNLRAMNVSILIDDFGTGYSSLSRLQSMAVTAVKIDRSFVSDIEGRGAVIIESTVMIARRLGIAVVAEGVETESQARSLRAMGVDLLQGYHFGRPASFGELELATRRTQAPLLAARK